MATDFQHYVGIVQDVYLEAAPAANVVRADVLPLDTKGNLDVAVVVENRGTARSRLTASLSIAEMNPAHPDYLVDPVAAHLAGEPVALEGKAERSAIVDPGGFTLLEFAVAIPDPKLWTPQAPNLYVLTVTLADESGAVDTFSTQFGVRTVEVGTGAKVLLNRRPAFFTGMARHEDWPDTGRTAGSAAFSMDKIARDLSIVRDTNVWFLRTAHYPNHPSTYILTDRMGFAVWEEIPAWWINMLSIRILLERGLALQMWREMIWDARNRPSVLFWSLANEPMWYLAFNLRQYVRALHADLDENYPDGRLVRALTAGCRRLGLDPVLRGLLRRGHYGRNARLPRNAARRVPGYADAGLRIRLLEQRRRLVGGPPGRGGESDARRILSPGGRG